MRLPRAEQADVPRNKVENYLLHPTHPIGGGKARFFLGFGFQREAWPALVEALRHHAVENEVVSTVSDEDGVTYLVEGPIATPSGRRPHIRSVWLIEAAKLAPRFISAYPLRRD